MNILDELVAKGVRGEVVVAVAELIATMKYVEEHRARDAQRKRDYRQRIRGCPRMSQDVPGQERKVSIPSKERTLSLSKSKNSYSDSVDLHFQKFWDAYPRREGSNPKKPALRSFQRAIANGGDPAVIIAAAEAYAQAEEKRGTIGTPYVPQAATWLNQDRWRDMAEAQSAEDREHAAKMEEWRLMCEGKWRANGHDQKDT